MTHKLDECQPSTSTSAERNNTTDNSKRPSKFIISPLKMTSILLFLFFLLPITTAQFCPTSCRCNDVELSVNCDDGELQNIPLYLNPRTRSLSIKNNQLTAVTVDELSFYQYLRVLDLSNNNIEKLEKHAFKKLTSLGTLKLNDNSLPLVRSDSLVGLESLDSLDLSNNKLSTINANSFIDMHKLQLLNLSYNAIDNVSANAFIGLDMLQMLDLQQNFVMEIHPTTYDPTPSLLSIDYSYNRLIHLPINAFFSTIHLTSLSFANNHLGDIHKLAFNGLTDLRRLNLRNNQLTRVPTMALARLTELKWLDLSGNLFVTMPTSCLDGLSLLEDLIVDNCDKLKSVELNAFSGLHSLSTLHLSNNPQLSYMDPQSFEHPNIIRHVSLANNALPTLPATLLDWTRMETVLLEGNAWMCTCEHGLWMRDVPRLAMMLEHVMCQSPKEVQGESVIDWSPSTLGCYDDEKLTLVTRVAIVVAAVAACLLLVILVLCCLHDRLFTFFHSSRSTASSESTIMRTSPYSDESYGSRCGTAFYSTHNPSNDIQRFMPPSMKQVQQVQQQHMYVQRRLSDHQQKQLAPFRTYTPALTVPEGHPTSYSTLQATDYRPLTVITDNKLAVCQADTSINTSETDYEEPCYASIPIYAEHMDPQSNPHSSVDFRVYTPSMGEDRDSRYKMLARPTVPSVPVPPPRTQL